MAATQCGQMRRTGECSVATDTSSRGSTKRLDDGSRAVFQAPPLATTVALGKRVDAFL